MLLINDVIFAAVISALIMLALKFLPKVKIIRKIPVFDTDRKQQKYCYKISNGDTEFTGFSDKLYDTMELATYAYVVLGWSGELRIEVMELTDVEI